MKIFFPLFCFVLLNLKGKILNDFFFLWYGRLFIYDIILKYSVWTASYCNGYTACGGTSCSFATLLEQQSKSSPSISSYYCGSCSYYCMVGILTLKFIFLEINKIKQTLVVKATSGSYSSTVYSFGVPCISSSLYSSFCNLDPKSVSSSYN